MTSGSTMPADAGTGRANNRSERAVFSSDPRGALALQLMIAAGTLVAVGFSLQTLHWHAESLVRTALILVLAVLYLESSLRFARMQRYLQTPARVNMVAVWIVAATLCIPLAYVAALVPVLLFYEALRGTPAHHHSRHEILFTICASTMAGIVAQLVFGWLRPATSSEYGARQALAVLASVLAFALISAFFQVLLGYLQMDGLRLRGALPSHDEQALQLATLVLGVLAAQLIAGTTFLTPIVLVLMGLLQRSAMVAQLQVAATTDAKTGLLNAAAWQELAQRELLRSQRDRLPGAVMLLDLDHFKRLNDTLGHLRGDVALKAVADSLRRELRGYDAVARFGGEEFVVFLNDLPTADAAVVAERILTRIRNLTITDGEVNSERYLLTASIGLAGYPEDGANLAELLEAADVALYGAKHDGRDRVGQPGSGRRADTAAVETRSSDAPTRSRTREAS